MASETSDLPLTHLSLTEADLSLTSIIFSINFVFRQLKLVQSEKIFLLIPKKMFDWIVSERLKLSGFITITFMVPNFPRTILAVKNTGCGKADTYQ